MRLHYTLFAIAMLGLAEQAMAQGGSRYDLSSPGASAPAALPSEDRSALPFDNRAIADRFSGTDLGASGPPKTDLPPVQPAQPQPVRSRPAAPVRQPPRTYGGSARGNTPLANPQGSKNTQYAKSLMRDALTPPQGSQLTGRRIALSDVVRAANSRSDQSESIGAYWDLCSTVADYYLSLHEQAELERLATRLPQTNSIRAALGMLKSRRDTALTSARATQLRLASLMGRSQASSLPLPGDMPLCTVYHTRYSQNFPNGGPREAAELDRLLPLRHAELLAAAAAVADTEDFFRDVVRRANEDEGEGVVKALQFLALNRRAFVQFARDYNKRIARYTELARPGNLRAERLVAMLIKTNSLASRAAQPVSPPPGRRSQAEPPPTFIDDFNSPVNAAAPRVDNEVLPAGAVEDFNMVEKIAPGESSVLSNQPAE